jgi:hypothetical protein
MGIEGRLFDQCIIGPDVDFCIVPARDYELTCW